MPFAIIKSDTQEVVQRFGTLPPSFDVVVGGNTKRIISPVAVGDEGLGYRFIEVVEVNFPQPGTYFTRGADTPVLSGNTLTITRQWTAWTQQEIDAYEVARKDDIANQFDKVEDIVRAAVLVIMDELNVHSTRLQQILNATAAATTLANFKTGMAAIQPIPQRTAAQLKTAIRTKIGNGV